jgi:hypothetical protein
MNGPGESVYLVEGLLPGLGSLIFGGGDNGRSRVIIRGISFELELAVRFFAALDEDVEGIVIPRNDCEGFLEATLDWLVVNDTVEAFSELVDPVLRLTNENDDDAFDEGFRLITFRLFSGDNEAPPPNTACVFVGGLVRDFSVVTGVSIGDEFSIDIGFNCCCATFGKLLFFTSTEAEGRSRSREDIVCRDANDDVEADEECSFRSFDEFLRRSEGIDI